MLLFLCIHVTFAALCLYIFKLHTQHVFCLFSGAYGGVQVKTEPGVEEPPCVRTYTNYTYDSKPPEWAMDLRVT